MLGKKGKKNKGKDTPTIDEKEEEKVEEPKPETPKPETTDAAVEELLGEDGEPIEAAPTTVSLVKFELCPWSYHGCPWS
jgi:hypothetical protein